MSWLRYISRGGWGYLILAAMMESGWLFCIRALNRVHWETVFDLTAFQGDDGWILITALAGYGLLGVGNAYFFYKSLSTIPSSVAFGVWTGLALGFTALAEAGLNRTIPGVGELTGMAFILLGIIGLKSQEEAKKNG